jgi:uncharacterized protein YyaL (SSP411 family)
VNVALPGDRRQGIRLPALATAVGSYGEVMSNRLAHALSPYLQQHADNPVHWWEWGDAAFAEAARRDVPVLLSVGYAACHWCHVMAHESFEDQQTAEVMNEHFVCVKVDREERPDVDAVYMAAVQAMTGRGGWPMTVFLTPQGRAFHAGTYYPPRPQHGLPAFTALLQAVAEAWRDRREEVEGAGANITARLARLSDPVVAADGPSGAPEPRAQDLAAAAASLRGYWDPVQGGFGGAPKFPPAMALDFLLRHHQRTGDSDALTVARHTAEAMARGGIYDQLGGGFARYSVDAGWVVPHFEKMLTDNALLVPVYVELWRQTGAAWARRVALETAQFLCRDLGTSAGGFAASLDADARDATGELAEGASYVWSPQELVDVLGADDGRWAAEVLSVTAAGTFEHGRSTLQLRTEPTGADAERWRSVRRRLLAARDGRPQPLRDDKVVTAWNGMAVAALVDVGCTFDQPGYLESARECMRLLVSRHVVGPDDPLRLVRASRDERVSGPAVLEDYAWFAIACQAMLAATGEPEWSRRAESALQACLMRFGDDHGGFFDTAVDETDPRLGRRPRDPVDSASPSGQFVLAGALRAQAALTGSDRYRTAALAALSPLAPLAGKSPLAVGRAAAVAEAMIGDPVEVAVVGEPDDPQTIALRQAAFATPGPARVIVCGPPPDAPADGAGGSPDASVAALPLLAGRGMVEGRPTAYMCRGFTCDLPVTTPQDLRRQLAAAPT